MDIIAAVDHTGADPTVEAPSRAAHAVADLIITPTMATVAMAAWKKRWAVFSATAIFAM
jgi:hypothetical protein